MSRFIKGMDLSTLLELERCGAKYYDHGKERDILDIMRDYDVDTIRLRLWNDPYSETGEPYGAGCNDLAETIAIGKKVSDAGFGVLLNFHYSDFWADPGKQIKPKAWKDFDADQLEQAVYEFTEDSLRKVLEAGVNVTMIQVGNEVTNGLLWPEGLKPNYDNIARFISSGIRACRAIKPEIPLMIHLDNGGNNEMYRDWFDHYMERGEDFDYIGLSYYPFWHGTTENLTSVLKNVASTYKKDVMVAETSWAYTLDDGDDDSNTVPSKVTADNLKKYDISPQGQADEIRAVAEAVNNIGDNDGDGENDGLGVFYWEPAWVPVGSGGKDNAELVDTWNK